MSRYWPFNKYPGTDYETFNWDWLLRTVRTLSNKVDDLYSTGLYDFVKKVLEDNPAWMSNFHKPYELERISLNNSTGYIFKISKAFPIKMHNTNTPTSLTDYAANNNLMAVFNAGYFYQGKPGATVIEDGEAWVGAQHQYTTPPPRAICAIKYDNTMAEYPNGTDATTMLADGVRWSTCSYGMVVENGVQRLFSSTTNPLQAIADDNGFWYMITVNGRSTDNPGCSVDQLAALAITRGWSHLFVLDGGGSLNSVIEGVEMADYVDDFGTSERNLYSMFYWEYPAEYVSSSQQGDRVNRFFNTLSKTILTLRNNTYTGGFPRVDLTTNGIRLATSWNGDYLRRNYITSNGAKVFSYEGPYIMAADTDLDDYDWPLAATTFSVRANTTGAPEGFAGYLEHIPYTIASNADNDAAALQRFTAHNAAKTWQRFIRSDGSYTDWEIVHYYQELAATDDVNNIAQYPTSGNATFKLNAATANNPAGSAAVLEHINVTRGTTVAMQFVYHNGAAVVYRRTINSGGTPSAWTAIASFIPAATQPTGTGSQHNGAQWFNTSTHETKTYYNGTGY